MIKYIRSGFTFLLTCFAVGAFAQSTATSSSPYSQFGLGLFNDPLLPQTRAMGGIGTAINKINNFNTINVLNPASYGYINLTTIDIGAYTGISTLSNSTTTGQTNANFRLSHFAFAAPVSKRSAISFGLMPYTELGYNYRQSAKGFGTGSPVDTNTVNYIYSGDGGLSKAYFGYGFGIGKHLSFGGNVSYIFGNLHKYQSTEVPYLYGALGTRSERSNSVGGLNYDLGTQVSFDLAEGTHLVFGYSAALSTKLNSKINNYTSQYMIDASGNEGVALDTLYRLQAPDGKIKLPMMNHFGVSLQKDGKFLVGADYSTTNWNTLTIGDANQGLKKSETYNVGGQFTPNANALHSYFARVDYRLGLKYDKTYINVNNTDINQYAVTFGLGLPIPRTNNTFYKINISAELGRRGTLENNLLRENFVNIHLGFTLNDLWFTKYRFD
ncbi:hypothetical protein [Mucilaginibacter lacusdianchii]|uniref:hypothetical protein n=1 Tax=Mucilaginibacter lacusdianchii TaxID=2684211 RepID=UPI00131E7B93|nr:hypothetical protein [Mucilaginibacter sp. JXJ CY 39]